MNTMVILLALARFLLGSATTMAGIDRSGTPNAVVDRVLLPPSSTRVEDCVQQFCILIYIGEGTSSADDSKRERNLGDLEVVRGGSTRKVTSSRNSLLLLRIGFENVKLGVDECVCRNPGQGVVCGCENIHFPQEWSSSVAGITVQGVSLKPGQELQDASDRNRTLIVALTNTFLQDALKGNDSNQGTNPGSTRIYLAPGQTHWLKPGVHWLKNRGLEPDRFISIEF